MKQVSRFLVVAAVVLSTSLLGSTTFAQHGGFSGGGGFHGGGGGFHSNGNFHGGGGFHGGFRGGFFFGFPYLYAPYPYYYDPYYYYPPPVYYAPTYYSPPAVYGSQATYVSDPPPPAPKVIELPPQQPFDRPLSPTAVDRDSPPPSVDQTQTPPPTIQRGSQGPPISVADVKALAKAGLSDEVILSHIRNSQAVYHLTTAEIIDLKNSGVGDKVIDFMINTASGPR